MKRPIKVVIWGFGAMGSTIADILLDKKGVEISGVCDNAPSRAGKNYIDFLHRKENAVLLSRQEGGSPEKNRSENLNSGVNFRKQDFENGSSTGREDGMGSEGSLERGGGNKASHESSIGSEGSLERGGGNKASLESSIGSEGSLERGGGNKASHESSIGSEGSREFGSKNIHSLIIEKDIKKVITPGSADIVILATDSFTKKAFPKIKYILENGINVISTAEEMAYPYASEPELAAEINRTAYENNVSVLGTGINPGFIMDLLVVMLTGVCRDVEKIDVERINSLSPFGPAVMEEQGVGLSPEDFIKGVENRSLAGHVGFNESIRMITDALGWKLDRKPEQTQKAIVSKTERKTEYAHIKPGEVAGCRQEGRGCINGFDRISMIHPQQIEPEAEGIETGDYIKIKGNPDISLSIKPEIPGGTGTAAVCVNMIPHVINASPGLKTMLDLPVPRAVLGDMRDYLDKSIG